jgi:very-short-patch-repair endonuclease
MLFQKCFSPRNAECPPTVDVIPTASSLLGFSGVPATILLAPSGHGCRNRQMFGQKFRREYPIPPYTADFCCPELLLVIEVDGSEHLTDAGQQRDCVRDEFLFRQGYRVLRIPGYDVFKDESSVITRIRNFVSASLAAKQSE